ncbi:hypothetical protein ACFYRN_09850 [Streptomyces sp. NPDC005227]|uniref:hypothetical protein n=1 Tax=Streptomyces sp. NPDC005227 TaxID=3364707 RepID=UPI0036765F8E
MAHIATTAPTASTPLASASATEQTINPKVTRALAQMELDKQAAKDAGLWDANYERMTNTLGKMFVEANDVDSVLEVCIGAIVTATAQDHGMRVVRANENAKMDGEIIVWRDSGLVILPHGMEALTALDQLRAALGEKAGQ